MLYKQQAAVPSLLQRRLNALSGLFETADDQFDRVRADRRAYIEEVRKKLSDQKEFLDQELNEDT